MTKKIYKTIILTFLAFVVCVLGAFFAIRKDKQVMASAATTTNENVVKWVEGASLQTNKLDTAMLRFILRINKSIFDGGKSLELTLFLPENLYDEGAKFRDYEDGNIWEQSITVNNLTDSRESGWGELYVPIVAKDMQQDVYVNASINGETAKSSTRNWYQVYDKLNESGSAPVSTWGKKQYEYKKNVDKNSFDLYGEAWMSSNAGYSFLANVPQNYLDLIDETSGNVLGKKVEERVDPYNSYSTLYTFEKYSLFFLSSKEAPNLTLTNNLELKGADTYSWVNKYFATSTVGIISYPVSYDTSPNWYCLGFMKQTISFSESFGSINGGTYNLSCEVIDFANQAICIDNEVLATQILEATDVELTEDERAWLQEVGGITPTTEQVEVTLQYKMLTDESNAQAITSVQETFLIKGVNAFSKTLATQAMYQLKGVNDISAFNVVRNGKYYQDGKVHFTGSRIVLQAKRLVYEYDANTQKGALTVVYEEFNYKDVSLKVRNNDPANPLEMDVYTSSVVVGADTTSLTFVYSTIEEGLYNSCLWLFDLTKDDIVVSGAPEGVSVSKNIDSMTVMFPNNAENDLMTLSLSAVAEIVEDVPYEVVYEYVRLGLDKNGDITEEWITSDPFTVFYSELVGAYNFENFMVEFGDVVRDGLALAVLEGDYFIPTSLKKNERPGERECTLTVQYTYNTLFKIANNVNDEVRYKPLNHENLLYYGDTFVDEIPEGYRVKNITTTSTLAKITEKEDYTKTLVEINTGTKQKLVIPINVEYTDKWIFEIEYFETYKDTCFAVKKKFVGDIRVSDYPDIHALTLEDVAEVLGKQDLEVCNLVVPKADFEVDFDKATSTYRTTLIYGHASLRQIDYDANVKEIQIYLSSYADWCAEYGQDWSILFLNTEEEKYFTYSNEIPREDLYGFFSAAIFEEKISDLNYWFKNNSGDGCMTIYQTKEVTGSATYKWYEDFTDSIFPWYGYTGMYFCEINNDENQLLYSYFFYLDGGTKAPYLSTGGAENAYDNDSALGNEVKDWTETLRDWFTGFADSSSNSVWSIMLRVGVALILVSGVVAVCYWLLAKAGVIKKRKRRRKK